MALEPHLTSRGAAEDPRGEAGFTLLEMVCVVAVVAMMAAVLLPLIPRDTSRARLESYSLEIASILKSDRAVALRRRSQISTQIDATLRFVRSGSSGRVVRVPDDVTFDATLASGCVRHETAPAISFFASGMSCGGVIALTRLGSGFEIRVNWLTGGIEIVPRTAS